MTIRTTTPNFLDNPPMPAQAKIAAAWTSFMFLYIYVDYFGLYKPGHVKGILDGKVWVLDVSPNLLTGMLASVAVPAMMVALSIALSARISRATNLVVAALYIPYSAFNAAGATWDWAPFYGLSIGLEVLLLAFIMRVAWTWPRVAVIPEPAMVAARKQGAV